MDFVAVIDIGKTNKKLCIFDEKLQLRHEVAASFPAQSGKYGLLYEQSDAIWSWFRQQFKILSLRITPIKRSRLPPMAQPLPCLMQLEN